ncbi:hypothetical protein PSHT_07547 [Puccinia striiformis]|uniref:Uncharacterized protein n=1 Tax=Puccinia striiformis TaxID=27350 RepID=A0A2S4VX16_9BASI|nr:hypothetical protein PSHT_07547 [Puccinia striiformis]
MYKCRWCHNPYKKSKGTFSNLTKHRDGTADRLPCPGRHEAITAGAKLPLTAKEVEKMDIVDQKEAMTHYLKHSTFDMRVFNQLLVIRFQLCPAWHHLNSRTWVATEAHRLYLNLQAKVVSTLQLSTNPPHCVCYYILAQTTDSGSNNFTMANRSRPTYPQENRCLS